MHSYFIIENHQTTIKIIQEILEEQGEYYCIGTSDDYEEGMNLILKHHPDMVFINIDQVDINTPDVFAYCREMQNYITNKIFFPKYQKYSKSGKKTPKKLPTLWQKGPRPKLPSP